MGEFEEVIQKEEGKAKEEIEKKGKLESKILQLFRPNF